jgi:Leucine-rich repeat (LRR) protein
MCVVPDGAAILRTALESCNLSDVTLIGVPITDAELTLLARKSPNLRILWLNSASLLPEERLRDLSVEDRTRLSRVEITTTGLAELQNLKKLEVLHIGGFGLTDSAIAFVADLPELRQLELSRMPLTDNALAPIGRVRALKHLYLVDTQVTGTGIRSLDQCRSLRTLGLTGAPLTAAITEYFEHSRTLQLTELAVDRAQLSDEDLALLRSALPFTNVVSHKRLLEVPIPDWIDDPQQARQYAAGVNRILREFGADVPMHGSESQENVGIVSISLTGKERVNDWALVYLGWIRSLEALQLARTGVTSAGMPHLTGLQRLQLLDLTQTQVSDNCIPAINCFEVLRRLHLSATNITDAGIQELRVSSQLKNLYVGGTQITDKSMARIGMLEGLEVLELRQCPITDAGSKELDCLSKLTGLDIGETQISRDEVARIRHVHPDAQVAR